MDDWSGLLCFLCGVDTTSTIDNGSECLRRPLTSCKRCCTRTISACRPASAAASPCINSWCCWNRSRWPAKTALVHPWLDPGEAGTADMTQISTSKSIDRVLDNLRRTSFMSSLHLTSMLAVVFSQPNSRTDDMRALFQKFDRDHNGTLSKEEFTLALQHMSSERISPDLANQLFENIDANHDKQISFSEFLAATLDPREVQISELNKAYELLDSEKKGYITGASPQSSSINVSHEYFLVEDLARVLDAKSNRGTRSLSRNGSLSHRDSMGKEAEQQDDRREANKPAIRKSSFGIFGL